MDFSTIKNIIFDLGNVIINLDYQKSHNAFSKLTKIGHEEIAKRLKDSQLFDKHGNGDLTDPEFRNEIRKVLELNASDQDIDYAFNELLRDIPQERLDLLKKLSKKYRLFLLSNTNFIHIEKVNEILHKSSGIKNLQQLFEKVYYSHELKLSKPYLKIDETVLIENNLTPTETVFIDDIISNTEGSKAAGMHAIQVLPYFSIIDIFAHEIN